MKLKANITEDTVTEYLTQLQKNLRDSKEGMVSNASEDIAGEIFELAPIWEDSSSNPGSNHALSESVLDFKNWFFKSNENVTVLDILVTGMDNVVSFKEFREDGDRFKPPDMDYAYYQETGIHSEAMQTPRERFFVKRATVSQAGHYMESISEQLELVMHGERITDKHTKGKLY